MRGNHIHWGRQDYTEPSPMSNEDRALVSSVKVFQRNGYKTWNTVNRDGAVIGYVSTRAGGQWWRTPEMDGWMFAADDQNHLDPKHGKAILRLLQEIDGIAAA